MRLVLDSEVQRMTGGLQVLALTQRPAKRRLRRLPPAGNRVHRANMARTASCWWRTGAGTSCSRPVTSETRTCRPATIARSSSGCLQASQPQYSDLFTGSTKNRPIVTVEVPVLRNDEVVYALSFSPPIATFQALVEQQRPSEQWTVSLLGRPRRRVRARAQSGRDRSASRPRRRSERCDGPEAGGDPVDRFARGRRAVLRPSRDRSLTGWTVAAGVAERSLVAPLWRDLAITSLIGGMLLLTGLTFAVRMATTIARGEMLHDLLIEELNHRVKNTLAMMQAIAVQTFRSASRSEREKFEGRLGALAEAHNLLSKEKWQGSEPAGRDRARAAALPAEQSRAHQHDRPRACRCRRGLRWCCR